jgi:hypothetical protein
MSALLSRRCCMVAGDAYIKRISDADVEDDLGRRTRVDASKHDGRRKEILDGTYKFPEAQPFLVVYVKFCK